MHEIKSFRIFQTAKVIAVLYAVVFAITAVFELVLFTSLGHGKRPPLMIIVLMPVFGSIFSFIGVAIACWLYNLIAPSIGGIAFELAPGGED
jgi:hypothetical protein